MVARREVETPEQLARELAWRAKRLQAFVRQEHADDYAQTLTYLLFAARWIARDDSERFTRSRALELLPATSSALRESLARMLDDVGEPKALRLLDDIADLLARTPVAELFADAEDPAIHFYQDFLDSYAPSLRRKMGVYYTPDAVVEHTVAQVDELVRTQLGLRLGLADPTRWGDYARQRGFEIPAGVDSRDFVVQILDPATGTGTFLLRVVESIHRTMLAEYADLGLTDEQAAAAWKSYLRTALLPRLCGFELMLAPFVIARLRLGLLLERGLAIESGRDPEVWGFSFDDDDQLRIFQTNTLALEGGELDEVERIKRRAAISIVLGNPPYERISAAADSTADWILGGEVPGRTDGRSLFDDIRDVAREHTIFSHLRSLPDRYVYFWRWALWKTFEQREGPGIVAFVSNGTWLSGPGFCGLRKLARELADEIVIVDLGGDKGGTRPEPNVFGIATPVAITSLVRGSASAESEPARARYRKIDGDTVEQKLAGLADPAQPWQRPSSEWLASLIPTTGDSRWLDNPALADLFPWQQPGCLASRTWPIAPDPSTLRRRWQRFVAAEVDERPRLFATAKTGRNIHTKVRAYPALASLTDTAEPEPIVRYCLRSFDRQWIFDDPRLLKTESPSLWQSVSDKQVFLCTLMSAPIADGPALTAAAFVPDFHHFRGSYGGKDVLPLYCDREATTPNVTRGLLARLGELLTIPEPTPEQLAAYVYALLSAPRYQARFREALATPGPRVPMTRDATLWARAVASGERLLWLHTYAERLCEPAAGRGAALPTVSTLRWIAPVTRMPRRPSDIVYDPSTHELGVGDGRVAGVRPEVWDYSVSGMQVVKKWLGYRTASGAGRAASSSSRLDHIRCESWPRRWDAELLELLIVLTLTVELQPEQAALLDAICDGPRISASELPMPAVDERRVRRGL